MTSQSYVFTVIANIAADLTSRATNESDELWGCDVIAIDKQFSEEHKLSEFQTLEDLLIFLKELVNVYLYDRDVSRDL